MDESLSAGRRLEPTVSHLPGPRMHHIEGAPATPLRRSGPPINLAARHVTQKFADVIPIASSTSMSAPPGSAGDPMFGNDRDERTTALLDRFRAGDEAAFETLFRMFSIPLCAFAIQIVKSRDVATEVVHDVFLRLWQYRERLEVRGSLKAYLYQATRNRALDVVRRDVLQQQWIDSEKEELEHDARPRAAMTNEMVEEHDLEGALQQVIDDLPERRRMVLLLRWRDGLRNDEVAELMGISLKTVEGQMTQALRTIRERLAPYVG